MLNRLGEALLHKTPARNVGSAHRLRITTDSYDSTSSGMGSKANWKQVLADGNYYTAKQLGF